MARTTATTTALLALAALVALTGTFAMSRLPHTLVADLHSDAFPNGLKHIGQHASNIAGLHHRKEERDWTDKRAYATIKFTVPPSVSDDFEEAWLTLEKEVDDKEDANEIFDLKKTKMDNLFYFGYGEWATVTDFVDHLRSDWFMDFAETADKVGVRWELQWLEDLSKDIEKEEREEKDKGVATKKGEREDNAYVLVYIMVPPGEAEGFVDTWKDAAEKTIKEEGNRMYGLSRMANDNTRFYAYGVWDSMDDYLSHFESEHVSKLLDYVAEKDIVWFLAPLEKIGHNPE